ncbi:hypothetical protein BH23BAC3_BH23BAC3_22560 [soil metagenome]
MENSRPAIFSIARNQLHDFYRKNGANPVEHSGMDLDTVPGDSFASDEQADEGKESLLVRQALQKLDSDKRQVLILSRFEGFRYTEIAEILGCTEGAVKVRVFRGLNELKDIITDLKKKEEI